MSQEFNVRIKGKIDTQTNFEASQEIYLDGELLTVKMNNGGIKFKVGDGFSTFSELKYTDENLIEEINLKANINSPIFSGIPEAPTAVSGTSTNQIATTKFVNEAMSNSSSGVQIKIQSSQPSGLSTGDFWYQII